MSRTSVGRIIFAVIAGYAANAVLVGVTEELFSKFMVNTDYLMADLITQCLYTMVGGYLCSVIAKGSKLISAAGLMALGLLVGTISLVTSWKAEPHWYGIGLLSVYAPCVWIGYMFERRMKTGTTRTL